MAVCQSVLGAALVPRLSKLTRAANNSVSVSEHFVARNGSMVSDAAANPFALLTLIVAPAVLTNAMSVLVLSTSNRFLRAGERLRMLAKELDETMDPEGRAWRLVHIGRIEKQAVLLLHAMRSAYMAMGSFVSTSLVSIVGAALAAKSLHPLDEILIVLGLAIGFVGAGSLVLASVRLFRATRLSMLNISEEAAMIRQRERQRSGG